MITTTEALRFFAKQCDIANKKIDELVELINVANCSIEMRPGLPSEASWLAHGGEDGYWIGILRATTEQCDEWERFANRPIITKITRNVDHWNWGLPGIGWAAWPGYPGDRGWWFVRCDNDGTKLPWLTDDELRAAGYMADVVPS